MKITIFTPTFNRAHTLEKLYNSLINQTSKQFEWLIIDDGSTDNTFELINKWKKREIIKIKYFKQANKGKAMAHNKGVELTTTELFTCVDSDDFLHSEAVEKVLLHWKNIKDSSLVGILAFKSYTTGKNITKFKNNKVNQFTLNEAYRKLGLSGDTMLIYKVDIISKFRFPKFEGESFVPENYLYDLIDQEGKLSLLSDSLYYVTYLNDGYSNNMGTIILNNPKGYISYINQRLRMNTNVRDKIFDTIRYIAICLATNKNNIVADSIYPTITYFIFPLGYIFYLFRYKKRII